MSNAERMPAVPMPSSKLTSGGKASGTPVSPGTVAAVIATYNRKELLGRCLDAVLGQTRTVDKIIVVDNCSTDGTPEFLAESGYADNRALEYVRLAENGGSAGGFYEGMKRAYEQGFDWLWVMDDDCVPLTDALAHLMECPRELFLRGCVVLKIDDPHHREVAFGPKSPYFRRCVRTVAEIEPLVGADGVSEGWACPFNGGLFSSAGIRQIGFPKKEMFIWGDEIEYTLRFVKHGVAIGTVFAARLLHPANRTLERRVRLGPVSIGLGYSEDPVRFYCYVRNYTYIALRYYGPFTKRFLKQIAYPLFFPLRTRLVFHALRDGLLGKFPPIARIRALVASQR